MGMTELNYSELVAGYYDNLNNNLRNFKGGPGFLETWVHDEDHARSLLEILALADEHGISALKIQLGPEVKSSLNLDWLRRNSTEYGSIEVQGDTLIFAKGKSAKADDEFYTVSEAYTEALKRQLKLQKYEGKLNAPGYSALNGSGSLFVATNAEGLVTEAKHQGFTGPKAALMDAFCGVLLNRPLQEGAEHGTIRLEALLHDPKVPMKYKGLNTPEIADPIFETPTKLVRQIFAEYLKKTGNKPIRNMWRDPIPAHWKNLPEQNKVMEAQKVLLQGCKELGLQESVMVTKVLNDTRFVLSYTQAPDKPDFGRAMIKLERWIRARLGFEIELQLESIEDRNKRVERSGR